MKIQSKELQDFINAVLTAIKGGVNAHDEFTIDGPIKFSLSIVKKQEKGGSFKIFVTDASGKFNKEEISKLDFKVKTTSAVSKKSHEKN